MAQRRPGRTGSRNPTAGDPYHAAGTIGAWREQLDAALASNEAKPSRERLTLIRVFEELRGLGFTGGYDAVRRYARGWGRERAAATSDAFVPLSFAPGEAYQFD